MRKLFFANWKTYLTDAEAETLARLYAERAGSISVDVAVAPSFTALERVARALQGSSAVLGAQDAFWNDEGAHTGEVSPKQLASLGAQFVIVGHSERRALGETDEIVARKADAINDHDMTPVVCIGESKEHRDAGRHETVVRAQLKAVLDVWAANMPLMIAYEPLWAIGTGHPCRPEDVQAMHAVIRGDIEKFHVVAPILYGGSVDPSNLMDYMHLPSVDGVLVGGASARLNDARAMLDLLSR